MRITALLLLLFIQMTAAHAAVEICHRRAKIAFGLVDHYWIKTDLRNAGMGSGLVVNEGIGDRFEPPFTKVFVIDHSDQVPEKCEIDENHDEDCLNEELEVGRSLGRFSPINNCQTFVHQALKRCEKPEYTLFKKLRSEYHRLKSKKMRQKFLTKRQAARLKELKAEYDF